MLMVKNDRLGEGTIVCRLAFAVLLAKLLRAQMMMFLRLYRIKSCLLISWVFGLMRAFNQGLEINNNCTLSKKFCKGFQQTMHEIGDNIMIISCVCSQLFYNHTCFQSLNPSSLPIFGLKQKDGWQVAKNDENFGIDILISKSRHQDIWEGPPTFCIIKIVVLIPRKVIKPIYYYHIDNFLYVYEWSFNMVRFNKLPSSYAFQGDTTDLGVLNEPLEIKHCDKRKKYAREDRINS